MIYNYHNNMSQKKLKHKLEVYLLANNYNTTFVLFCGCFINFGRF